MTLHESTFCLTVGEINYNVLVDLKTLQGEKAPYFNATEIVKQYNLFNPDNQKRLVEWKRSKRFKDLVNLMVGKSHHRKLHFIEGSGNKKKMMVHKELFLSLMIWLDAKHEIAVTSFVNRVVEKIDVAAFTRAVSKSLSRPMTNQVKILQEKLAEEKSGAAPHIYTTISKQIHRAATGRPMPKGGEDQESLSLEESNLMVELRDNVELQLDYMFRHEFTGREAKDVIKTFLHGFKA